MSSSSLSETAPDMPTPDAESLTAKLRALAAEFDNAYWRDATELSRAFDWEWADTLEAAADEIDRLRAALAASRSEGQQDRERLDWLDENAGKELVIDRDGDDVQLKEWHRKYVSYHNAYGRGIRECIDTFRRARTAVAQPETET